jgi:hypothetical protein
VDVRGVYSGDGAHVLFETAESLVAEDLDQESDVYETDGRTVSLVSIGPTGGNGPHFAYPGGVSFNGSHVFFMTREALVPEDVDGADIEGGTDVYERGGGATRLISTIQPDCLECNFVFAGASDDGRHVFFHNFYDVYESFEGTVTLASTGPTGRPGAIDSVETFLENSADGTHLFFHSRDNLVAEDHDNCGSPGVTTPCQDFYERVGGETHLISTGPTGGNARIDNFYGNSFAASRDGRHAVFATPEPLVAEDTDTSYDLYDRANGETRLVSTGPSSTGAPSFPLLGYPNTNTISDDGGRIFFTTEEQLVPEDQDALRDVYLRADDTTTLISTGPRDDGAVGAAFDRATPSGDHVLFRAFGRLTANDRDSLPDTYEWSRGKITLVSIGPAGGNGNCDDEEFEFACRPGVLGVSVDGRRVSFGTEESLVANDTDHEFDTYVRIAGMTRLVTRGTVGGNGPFHASGVAMAPDGQTVWFQTAERLSPSDQDAQLDLYVVRAAGPKPCARCDG